TVSYTSFVYRFIMFTLSFSLSGLFSIVSCKIDLLQLGHQRISGVGSCALVVKRLIGHLIQSLQEIFLVYAVVSDGRFDLDRFFQLLKFLQQLLASLLVAFSLKCRVASTVRAHLT